MVRLTDRPDMTLDVYRGRKTTMQQQASMAALIATAFSVMGKALSSKLSCILTGFVLDGLYKSSEELLLPP